MKQNEKKKEKKHAELEMPNIIMRAKRKKEHLIRLEIYVKQWRQCKTITHLPQPLTQTLPHKSELEEKSFYDYVVRFFGVILNTRNPVEMVRCFVNKTHTEMRFPVVWYTKQNKRRKTP